MGNQNWISLFDYSVKYGVSMSTLRRRIKSHSILFKLDAGKYFLLDEPAEIQEVEKKPETNLPVQNASAEISQKVVEGLVEELKAAYAKILQEKEEQIGILKEEIVDLKMLVNLLEKQQKTSNNTFFFPEVEA